MASEREFCGQSAVAIGDVATYVWRDSYECSCLRQRSACDWEDLGGHNKNRVPAVTGDVIALGASRVQRARDGSMSE
jgi:hypothetical protein